MPTRDDVIVASAQAVQDRLRVIRPKSTPWRDEVLENKGGAGYNFSNRTLRPFVKSIYGQLKVEPVMVPVSNDFDLPMRLPVGILLAGKVSALEIWVAGDVCKQLSL